MSAAEKFDDHSPELYPVEDFAEEPRRVKKKVEEGEGPWLVSYADLMTLLMGFFALLSSMGSIDTAKVEEVRRTAVETFGGKLENPYEELSGDIKKFLKSQNIGEKVQLSISLKGIQLSFQGTLFFASGDFRVKEKAKPIVAELARIIKNKDSSYRFLVEGHTDSVPIHHHIIASNWELSGLRAARIAHIFEDEGFDSASLTIVGWGDTKPIVEEYDGEGRALPDSQAKNRRVVIRVYDPKITNDPFRE